MPEHDHTVIGWRAWYDDLSVYDSKTMNWADLPDDGVQVVVVYEAELRKDGQGNYRGFYKGHDYYWTTPESGLEVFTGNEHPAERYPGSIIKRGKWVPIKIFEQIRAAAVASKEF